MTCLCSKAATLQVWLTFSLLVDVNHAAATGSLRPKRQKTNLRRSSAAVAIQLSDEASDVLRERAANFARLLAEVSTNESKPYGWFNDYSDSDHDIWFTEDVRKLQEMPPYQPNYGVQGLSNYGSRYGSGEKLCKPRCDWTCEKKVCDQVCEPFCLPPTCKTFCGSNTDNCETRCGPPQCAVVCPQTDCGAGECPKCRTVCSPPPCTTQCGSQCKNVCTKPQCTWRCHLGSCPRPKCTMKCPSPKPCKKTLQQIKHSKIPCAGKAVSEGMASLDARVLLTTPTPPPKWDMPVTVEQIAPGDSILTYGAQLENAPKNSSQRQPCSSQQRQPCFKLKL